MKLHRLARLNSRRSIVGALFVLSSILGGGILAACDTGGGTSAGPSVTALPQGGEAIFAKYCNTCHPGGGRGAGPSLIQSAPRFSDTEIQNIVRHGKDRMPGFGSDRIADADLAPLVAYIRSLK